MISQNETMEGQILKKMVSNIMTVICYFAFPELLLEIYYYLGKAAWAVKIFLDFTAILYLLFFLILYLLIYNLVLFLIKIYKSGRFDILLSVILGLMVFFLLNQNFLINIISGIFHYNFSYQLLFSIKNIILFSGFFAVTALYIYLIKRKLRVNFPASTFFSDHVDLSEHNEKDLLNIENDARSFAAKVVNDFSIESMVFGIDAPWGSGKTTYLSFANDFWLEKYKDKVIVFNFQPQSLESGVNIFDKFVEGLVEVLKENNYIPEIQSNIFKYFNFLKNIDFSIKFFTFSIPFYPTTESPLEDLKKSLKFFDKKIIVIIDDLDRLPINDIKEILNIVKKSFVLPNVTYILCYDTENIDTLENKLYQSRSKIELKKSKSLTSDADETKGNLNTQQFIDNRKITEFFEKVVNVKVTLFPDQEALKNFLLNGLIKRGFSESNIIRLTEDSWNILFSSDKYYNYRPVLGDLRKVKRFLNTIILLDRFKKLDSVIDSFNGRDLINLILIYINYPHVFRKIYDTECNKGFGFFSVKSPYDEFISGRNEKDKNFYNSDKYFDYINTLNDSERFIVEEVFSIKKRVQTQAFGGVDPQLLNTLACFNGCTGTDRNLQRYLDLIVKNIPAKKTGSYVYFLTTIKKLKEGLSLKEVFDQHTDVFDLNKGEKSFASLFNIISESSQKLLLPNEVQKVIDYILDNIPNFSSVQYNESEIIGLRDNLIYKIIRLLDQGGWEDGDGRSRNNTSENIKKIAYQIFGEGEFSSRGGILKILSEPSRGVLGIYDLMLFRLLCSHDRQGGTYNLFTALGIHESGVAKTQGLIIDLAVQEMREISQLIFSIFDQRFIKTKINFISETQNLSLESILGQTFPLFEGLSEENKELLRKDSERIKNKIISFVFYQLTNSIISMGVGCGFYDLTGTENKKGINAAMENYLFDVCFDLDSNPKNAEVFVDYMMIHFSRAKSDHFDISFENEVAPVIDPKRLSEFWVKNKDAIVEYLKGKNKNIYTLNFDLSYEDDLKSLYDVLDELLKKYT